jgi:hypothetical protein
MDNAKTQLAAKLKDANNVLVTVSTNPSVDQLAAAIGLTLFLSKLKKHATTVFSGQVPSTIDFLKPEETIEDNTDSLRDFIISLDKSKADKIRYKVEDTMVKIFITPYRTSIGEQDLVFSQGDFNVDVVIALGIHNKDDLDQAITAHGRILHDATVATLNIGDGSELGTLNWIDPKASSLCEMAVALTDLLKSNALDGQMATAFLTGIVAETERFSNEKTTSTTMNASAKLMTAGANQQLVATKLEPLEGQAQSVSAAPKEKGGDSKPAAPKDAAVDEDGALRIDHESTISETKEPVAPPTATPAEPPSDILPPPLPVEPELPEPPKPVSQVKIDDQGELRMAEPHIKQDHRHILNEPPQTYREADSGAMFGLPASDNAHPSAEDVPAGTKLVTEPPQFGGRLSAAADDSNTESSSLNLPPVDTPLLSHDSGPSKRSEPPLPPPPPPVESPAEPPPSMPPNLPKAAEPQSPALPSPLPSPTPPPSPPQATTAAPPEGTQPFVQMDDKTLDDIEQKVDSPHAQTGKLPEPFVKSLNNSTLAGLEERTHSPHLQQAPPASQPVAAEPIDYHQVAEEQIAKALSNKTLDDIEHKVDSPHLAQEPAEVSLPDEPKKEDPLALAYEPHESEPPDVGMSSGPAGDDDASDAPTAPDDTATSASDDDASTQDSGAASDESADSNLATPTDTTAPDAGLDQEKQDAARDAVEEAIKTGGDGRDSLPPLDAIGTAGLVDIGHEDAAAAADTPPDTPPPLPPPSSTAPSPHIETIDDKGNISFKIPNSDTLPTDNTAAPLGDVGAAPPVPPPLMPPPPTDNQDLPKAA